MSARRIVRLAIRGRVQGVWYRGWTVDAARARGLDGWVRNRVDGSVEAVLAGPADVVAEMIAACRQGPPAARVDAIDVSEEPAPPPPGFHQHPTA